MSDTTVGAGTLSQFLQNFNKMARATELGDKIRNYSRTMPELQNVQRFLATPLSCLWWTSEPNKMLNMLKAVNSFVNSINPTNKNYNKIINVQNNLQLLSFRMLILSVSVIGKLVSVPVIHSLLQNPNYISLFLKPNQHLNAKYAMRNYKY
eukprot:151283_1